MRSMLLFLMLAAVSGLIGQPSRTTFSDSFKSAPDGSDGRPNWHIVKGNWHMRGGQYEQTSAEYDCASMLDMYMDSSFEFEAAFEQVSGDPGVGFIFASRRVDETAYAQMARFDGGTTFLAGYFQGGEFTGTVSTKAALLVPGKSHTLLLRVNRETQSWTIRLDGTPIFDGEIPMHYGGGYIGLQSSAGSVRFNSVAVRKLHSNDPFAVGWEGHDWIGHFAVIPGPPPPAEPNGELLIPDARLGLVRGMGQVTFRDRTVVPLSPKGVLVDPTAVAFVDSVTIVVTDRGASQVHLFDSRTYAWKASAGWKGKSLGTLDEPCAVAANANRRIFVVERKNNRVQVFDDSLRSLSEFGSDRLKSPSDIALQGDSIFVLNAGLSQIECYRWDGAKTHWIRSISYGGGEGRCIAVRNDTIYLSVVNQVRAYSLDGTLLHTLLGRSIGYIFPEGIGFDHKGRVYIGDYIGSRVIITDPALTDPLPVVLFTSGDPLAAEIRWTNMAGSYPAVRFSDTLSGALKPTAHSLSVRGVTPQFVVKNLRPSTTYHFQIKPGALTVPYSKFGGNFSFTTTGTPKAKQYSRLPMAAVIFTNVADDRTPGPSGTLSSALSASEVERIKAQIRDGVRFYWIQSGMRLFLDVDFVVVTDPLKRSEVYGSDWWYPPKESLLASTLAKNGRSVSSYSSFLYLPCVQTYDTTLHRYMLYGRGGGFTNGVGTGKGYGISWWDVTRKDHNAGNNWLMVHEFNHQLDDIFMVSGYPEYWFNHISPTIGTASASGEHFDANADIIRMVPDEEWTDLKYTTLAEARDADMDGIPDNAPGLPLDEVRLGSDSTRADSDGDGVSDLQELLTSNWITEGWGETYGAKKIFPDLTKADTDGDGLTDDRDPYPCYPEQPFIHRLSFARNANLIGTLADTSVRASLSSWWDDSTLTIACELDKARPVKIMLDAGADGWFQGRGNYLILLTPGAGNTLTASVQIFNATDPSSWPFMDKSLSDTIRLKSSLTHAQGRYRMTVIVPRNEFLGLTLRSGDALGILFGVQCPFGDEGSKRYIDLFEPNRLMHVHLSD